MTVVDPETKKILWSKYERHETRQPEKTFELLCAGDTEGVFQVESSGMTDLTMNLKPQVFRDVVVLGALYRPGPLSRSRIPESGDNRPRLWPQNPNRDRNRLRY